MKVISFCLFGDNPKYTRGMVENLKIIQEMLPDFLVYIHVGSGVPPAVVEAIAAFPHARVVVSSAPNWALPAHRICYPDEAAVVFARDADSRINARDVWAMNEFIKSDKTFHIVRDHVWHKSKIMAGLCGRKQSVQLAEPLSQWAATATLGYGSDEAFLSTVYPRVAGNALIHSSVVGYLHEPVTPLPPLENSHDFLGNVVNYREGEPYFEFAYQWGSYDHYKFLLREEQWRMLIAQRFEVRLLNEYDRKAVLFGLYMANFYTRNYAGCQAALAQFEATHTFVDEHVIANSSFLFPHLKKRVVASTDVRRVPGADEIVIQYGNYPYAPDNLPIGDTVRRHPVFFKQVQHDAVEFDDSWAAVDHIYILNLKERRDRYLECLVELCRMGAPLDRVTHFEAKKEKVCESAQTSSLHGAGENHIWAVRHFLEHEYENCLVLEDDFTFSSNVGQHQRDLKLFFERRYAYDVCLLGTSNFGERRDHDDLLLTSHQPCTTTAAYLLNRATAPKILAVFVEGNRLLLETGNGGYTCDRYWNKLHFENKFFVFRTKFGFQRPNFSNITGVFSCHFD